MMKRVFKAILYSPVLLLYLIGTVAAVYFMNAAEFFDLED